MSIELKHVKSDRLLVYDAAWTLIGDINFYRCQFCAHDHFFAIKRISLFNLASLSSKSCYRDWNSSAEESCHQKPVTDYDFVNAKTVNTIPQSHPHFMHFFLRLSLPSPGRIGWNACWHWLCLIRNRDAKHVSGSSKDHPIHYCWSGPMSQYINRISAAGFGVNGKKVAIGYLFLLLRCVNF